MEPRIGTFSPQKPIFEYQASGQPGLSLPPLDVPEGELSIQNLRHDEDLDIPHLSELTVLRHYTKLSQKNFSIDTHVYPLGSCTMKYNPRINEHIASFDGFVHVHPLQPEHTVQGLLALYDDLSTAFIKIVGLDHVSLQPAAGAHGEFAGMLMIQAYMRENRTPEKNVVLIPESAHGTNPSSAAMAGFTLRGIKTDKNGLICLEHLEACLDDSVAAIMLTNPNTYGLFESHIEKIAKMVHAVDGILYYDGANLNAIIGQCRPGDMGFDLVHLNVHKTFSTPHGGGGPGGGPILCGKKLAHLLPGAQIVKNTDSSFATHIPQHSIGHVRGSHGNTLVLVRALSYICSLGCDGLREVSEIATLNANYMRSCLKDFFSIPYKNQLCKHEFVLSLTAWKTIRPSINVMDLAKRMIDLGFHPPTVYFPTSIPESLMIEPTETESKADLDLLIDAIKSIAKEAQENPSSLLNAPQTTMHTPSRIDEAYAARNPCFVCINMDPS